MGADSRIAAGTILGGKFRIRRLLGQGGMGEVYAGEGRRGEKVAIKVLHDRAAQDPDLVARFNREAEIARSIRSDYVAAVLGSGKERDGRLWIAFERLVGEGLDERLGARPRCILRAARARSRGLVPRRRTPRPARLRSVRGGPHSARPSQYGDHARSA